ncbi:MAG: trypsin-like serine protease [Verrucomicrobia bacterium]|nr:trypsin-like serine protease [Verrucomicrobiota bacterium]
MSRRLLILIGLGGALLETFLPKALALILYGTGPTDLNNAQNTTPPANGSPWYNLVQFGQNNASGVYLGNGYVLTANHVSMVDSGLVINGVSYNRDLSFTPLQITENEGTTAYADSVDLKLIKIFGSPPLPVLQSLPLNFSTTDVNLTSTIMGWGVGKGSIISNQGWLWGGDNTRAQRWGTSTTASSSSTATYSGYQYDALRTYFYRAYGSTTAEIAIGDSGGGLFQKFSNTWKLSGITTTVLQYLSGAAQYDGILGGSVSLRLSPALRELGKCKTRYPDRLGNRRPGRRWGEKPHRICLTDQSQSAFGDRTSSGWQGRRFSDSNLHPTSLRNRSQLRCRGVIQSHRLAGIHGD